ncbi:hypothetical protein WAB17_14220 [Parerythrobacter aurantius]|uniref:hypothetical protein n=1 Tax=Parerythrobacter aurantius TaxID=3127706 RepID=UPI0032441C07
MLAKMVFESTASLLAKLASSAPAGAETEAVLMVDPDQAATESGKPTTGSALASNLT